MVIPWLHNGYIYIYPVVNYGNIMVYEYGYIYPLSSLELHFQVGV